jgi:uncharacterized protein
MFHRHIHDRVSETLADTRVVLLAGPRQSGKTTLARDVTRKGYSFVTLDDQTVLNAARSDPVGFVRSLERAVIDEVQRAPELLLAIKQSVDLDTTPGRFLLTGSSDLMTSPQVADSLAGRMATLDLLPLAQAEIDGTRPTFLPRLMAGNAPAPGKEKHDDLVARVLAGGFPEALQRSRWDRRRHWHQDYVRSLLQKDVHDIAQVDRVTELSRLIGVLAHHSAQLVNYSSFGSALGLSHVTTQRYVGILEQLYVLKLLPPWFGNALKRLVKTPKIHFLDSGLLASLTNISPERVAGDRALFGPLLETFVVGELRKLASWETEPIHFFFYRDKDQVEVDVVLEDFSGRIAGIEIKASATVNAADFAGLRKLAAAAGQKWAGGVVLCDHDEVTPFGDRLWAAPVSSLWR